LVYFEDDRHLVYSSVLAACWSAGGGVVVADAATVNGENFAIQGAWASGGYRLFDPLGTVTSDTEMQPVNRTEPDSPLLVGVTALNTTNAVQSTGLPVTNVTVVARWGTSGRPLIVRGTKARPDGSTGNLVELNMLPPSATVSPIYWVVDGTQIMHNA
jgi:hypothetical protein